MASILILEDNFVLATEWSLALEELGHTVTIAPTASDALTVAYQHPFDAIITDIFIEVDGRLIADGGISFIVKMRNSRDLHSLNWRLNVPIVAVSGAIGINHRVDPLTIAKNLGANFTLRKPFQLNELIDPLQEILESTRTGHDVSETPAP